MHRYGEVIACDDALQMGTEKNRKGFWSRYFDPPTGGWPLAVRSLGYNRCRPGLKTSLLKHPWHHWFDAEKGRVLPTLTLVHVLRGGGVFRSSASGELEIPANSLVFAFPNVRHFYWFDEKTGWDDEWLEVEAETILSALDDQGVSPKCPVIRLGSSSRIALVFRRLFDLARHGASEVRLAAGAYEVLATAFDEIAVGESRTSEVGDPVGRMASSLCSSETGSGSVREAARRVGLSASRMRTVFREKMGLSPKQYQMKVRLDRAAKLLSDRDTRIADIAEQVGFRTPAAFSTAFAKAFGLSPVRYRRRQVAV